VLLLIVLKTDSPCLALKGFVTEGAEELRGNELVGWIQEEKEEG